MCIYLFSNLQKFCYLGKKPFHGGCISLQYCTFKPQCADASVVQVRLNNNIRIAPVVEQGLKRGSALVCPMAWSAKACKLWSLAAITQSIGSRVQWASEVWPLGEKWCFKWSCCIFVYSQLVSSISPRYSWWKIAAPGRQIWESNQISLLCISRAPLLSCRGKRNRARYLALKIKISSPGMWAGFLDVWKVFLWNSLIGLFFILWKEKGKKPQQYLFSWTKNWHTLIVILWEINGYVGSPTLLPHPLYVRAVNAHAAAGAESAFSSRTPVNKWNSYLMAVLQAGKGIVSSCMSTGNKISNSWLS